jgi:hypothetical protein
MPALLILGGILFLIGGIVALTNIKNWKRRKRILDTPTSPIAQAPGNGFVEVKGRIVPSEQGLVWAPFSGRQGVWVRVVVQELRSTGRSSYWATILNEIDGREFYVDDGSGQMARIRPQMANVILDRQNVASSGTFNDAPPHLEGFLASRGLKSTSWLGFNKSMRYEEELLMPNDPLYALGPSTRQPGPPVNDGYRMVPSSQLVMYAGGGDNELILTNKSEDQLVSKLGTGLIIGLVLTGIGAVIGLVGLAGAIAMNL